MLTRRYDLEDENARELDRIRGTLECPKCHAREMELASLLGGYVFFCPECGTSVNLTEEEARERLRALPEDEEDE